MRQSDIKTVVFDLGGVLIDWNPRHLYRNIFDSEADIEWFLENITTPEWNREQDAGRSFETAVSILQSKYPAYTKQIKAYYYRWPEMIGGEIQDSVSVLKQVKSAGYPLYALTNWSAQTFPMVIGEYAFFNHFDGIVVSGHEGVAKPDPQIYQVLIDRYGIDPYFTLFIDDSEPNIISAQELGFHTIHFESSKQMKKELVQFGILR
ncbi:MAG TPA: HAD family phosphatase [Balneolales bacterium]|nr:HAD family phosphatase [Balneolales bacterium]